MEYIDDTEQARKRKERKEARRAENKRKWAERNEALKAKLPIGYSATEDKKRMQEFKNQLLTEHNVTSVTRKVLAIALDDEHPGQMAALKMCWDRQMPVSIFEENDGKAGVTTVIIDRSCGGKVTIKGKGGDVEIDNETYLGSPETYENGE